MVKSFFRIFFLIPILLFTFHFSLFTLHAQEGGNAIDRQKKLESDLDILNKEISTQRIILENKQREGVSLERDITILGTKIEKAKLLIRARTLAINDLGVGIKVKDRTIDDYSTKIDQGQDSLVGLMRRTNELDGYSIADVTFSDKSLSEFFTDIGSFYYIEGAIDALFEEIKSAKEVVEEEKTALEEKKSDQINLRYTQEVEKKRIKKNEDEKVRILKVTKGQEKEYKKVLKEKQARAASIRAELFSLRDSGQIKFGQALDYANIVSQKTGIRPAFLLAIFVQESNLGKNQGGCYLRDFNTGAGISSRTNNIVSRVMNPKAIKQFLKITENVGRDPLKTLVSCPQEIGWGGAMGAAQFIPSTWAIFEDRITTTLGIDVADPWRPRDAFTAAGLYLTDLGAAKKTYVSEREAACRYYSGRSCGQSSWATNYGNQVMRKAEKIQTTMIDPIENS